MRIKLDENISHHLAASLARLGHDVDSVLAEGLLSRPDADVAAAAGRDKRMLVTLDKRFVDARYIGGAAHTGVVLFRLRDRKDGALSASHFIESFVARTNLENFANCIVVVTPKSVRVRKRGLPQ